MDINRSDAGHGDSPRPAVVILTTGRLSSPRSGGELRTFHLARELARLGHAVDVFSFVVRRYPCVTSLPEPRFRINEFHSPWLDLAVIADRLRLIPITELPVWLSPLKNRVQKLISSHKNLVIQYEYPWFSRIFMDWKLQPKLVFNTQNIETEYWRAHLSGFSFSKLWSSRFDMHFRHAVELADLVGVCSPRDQEWLTTHYELRRDPLLIPNGFDTDQLQPPGPEIRASLRRELGFDNTHRLLLFVGSDTPHNRAALRMLLEQVTPNETDPRSRYLIVGRVGQDASKPVDPRVIYYGQVPDIHKFLFAADIALNPVESGSGSNVKLIEYLGAGLPVLTTSFGLRGFESLADWVNIAQVHEFARLIPNLSSTNRKSKLALEHYTWRAIARRLSDAYQALFNSSAMVLAPAKK